MQIINNRGEPVNPTLFRTIPKEKKTGKLYVFQYPYIDREAYKETIYRYKAYVQQYNQKVEEWNDEITRYNILVDATLQVHPVTPEEGEGRMYFHQRICHLPILEYNQKVESYNRTVRPVMKKRLHKTVKYASTLIFEVVLNFTAAQIKQRNGTRMELGKTTAGILPKTYLNPYEIAHHRIANIPGLSCSQATVARHLRLFRDAGILMGYEGRNQHGTKKPVKAWVAPEILVVKDAGDRPKRSLEPQIITLLKGTDCPDIIHTTRALLKNHKKKGELSVPQAEKAMATGGPKNPPPEKGKDNNDKNLKDRNTQQGKPLRPAGEKPAEKISTLLKDSLLEPSKLGAALAGKTFTHYQPIDLTRLEYEARKGTIDRETFTEIAIQDTLKLASSLLYAHSTPYEGSWMKAYWIFTENKLHTFTGIPFHKDTVVETIKKWRWMLRHAKRWFERTHINPLFPGQYFDITRKDACEVGFWYLEKAWQRNEEKKARRKLAREGLKRQAAERRKKISHNRKLEKQLRRYLSGKINEKAFYDYVRTNLPHHYLEHLGKFVKIEMDRKHNPNT